MTRPALLFFILLSGLQAGCRPQPLTIKGQVFVAMEGGKTVPLSLASITLYPSASFTNELESVISKAEKRIAELQALAPSIDAQPPSDQKSKTIGRYEQEMETLHPTYILRYHSWPHQVYRAAPDSDGRFTITVPPGHYHLVTHQVLPLTIRSYSLDQIMAWSVPVSCSTNLILSNQNFIARPRSFEYNLP